MSSAVPDFSELAGDELKLVPIELPSVLQAHRGHLTGEEELADSAEQLQLVQQALAAACEYGQLLWRELDGQRRYLLGSLPPAPPVAATGPAAGGAHPTGPADEAGWARWMAAYAGATSALAGPNGDSGYGRSEAEREAQARRH
ncbi:MAG TPA: hypothetical protein VHO01_11045 [Jatrophihabitans sp.]|nr:hypothetical protein [Jatrophihabitans sp.]